MSQSPPSTLGKYQIIREIARSNDIVYEAYDPVMNRRVAVKELAMPSGATDSQKDDRIKRFMREAKAAGSLVHPNIVTVYEVSEEAGRHYLAMEFLDGETLRKSMDDDGALSPERSVEVAIEVLKGLDFAHKHGVVHRDVKPDNIQILSDGTIKLTDFGIARLTFEPNLTMDGQVFGTPSYMSPEQINGKEIDQRSDLFSVGIVLYEMVAGTKPFTGDNVMAISYSIMNYDPPQPPAANYLLWTVLSKVLDKSPALRHDSAEEMIAELKQVLKSFNSVVIDHNPAPWNQPPAGLTHSAGVAGGPPPVVPPYGAGAYGASQYGQVQPYGQPGGVPSPYNQQPYQPGGGQGLPGQMYPYHPNTAYQTPYQSPVTPYGTPNPLYPGGGAAPPTAHSPYGAQTPYGGSLPGPMPGAQVPVYYPPPPRQPLFKAETKAVFWKVVTAVILVGTLFGLILVGINALAESYPAGGSVAPPRRTSAGEVSTRSVSSPSGSVSAPSADAGRTRDSEAVTEPLLPTGPGEAQPDLRPPFDLASAMSEADGLVAKGAATDLGAARRRSWGQADELYVRAMGEVPEQSGAVQERAVGSYLLAGDQLAGAGDEAGARQAGVRARGMALGNPGLESRVSQWESSRGF